MLRAALEAKFWFKRIGLELCVHFKNSESASTSIVKLVGCCMYEGWKLLKKMKRVLNELLLLCLEDYAYLVHKKLVCLFNP